MTTEENTPEVQTDEAVEATATPATKYVVHGVMRAPAHRTHRAQSATHGGRKVYVGANQSRIVPGQRLHISEAMLHRDLEDLRKKAAAHIIEVRTLDGRIVDLETLQPGPSAPAVVQPHPVLDSVANDTPVGQYIPPYVGDDSSMPRVLKPGEKPALLEEAARDYEAPPVADVPDAGEAPVDDATDAAVEAAQADAAADESAPATPAEQKAAPSNDSRKNKRNR